jgi:phosphatidylglycerophosphate synthase
MLEDYAKGVFQKLIGSRIIKLQRIGLNANRITYISIISAIVAAYFFYKENLIVGGVFVLLDYFFDGMDGLYARKTKSASNVGFILDHISDYVLRRIWYFALASSGFLSYELVSLAIFTLAISVFMINLAMIKNFSMPKWTMAWADWLIIPAVFTGEVVFFFQIMIIVHIILFMINFASIIYLNR